jgi:hypothetical protein
VNKIFLAFVISFISTAVFASNVRCDVMEAVLGSNKKKDVPVTIFRGGEEKPVKTVKFMGKTYSALWNQGDDFETQTSLTMKYGNLSSTIYDVLLPGRTGPLNVMEEGDIRFQCWID